MKNDAAIEILTTLTTRLHSHAQINTAIIKWATPVISFGNYTESVIATLGINPSDKEFIDNNRNELSGLKRRFHTLNSLGLSSWEDIKPGHLKMILESCLEYFVRNPYDNWFKKLDKIIAGTGTSYYFPSRKACHLDLIPYATTEKWASLSLGERTNLLRDAGEFLGLILKNSPIKVIVLNGKTVIDNLEKIADVQLDKMAVNEWDLRQKDQRTIVGYSYKGVIKKVGNIVLDRDILVLGYNHNIQSSWGITSQSQAAIANWIASNTKSIL